MKPMIRNICKATGFLFFVLMLGCGAGGQWKTTTSIGGRTTVRGDEKTMQQERLHQEQETARIEAIRKAEKRKSTDRIIVALYRPEISEKLEKSIKPEMLFDMLRKEFEKDKIIVLVNQAEVDKAQKQAGRKNQFQTSPQKKLLSIPADISVFTFVSHRETVGINKSTKKTGTMVALVFSGEVVSHYLPEDQYKVEKMDTIFKNAELTKAYANEVIQTIKTRPSIPGEAFKKAMQEEQKKAFLNMLKGIAKPQQPQS